MGSLRPARRPGGTGAEAVGDVVVVRPQDGETEIARRGERERRRTPQNLSSSKKLGRSTTFTLTAARDLDFSIFQSNNYYIADRLSAGFAWDVTRRTGR